MIVCIGCLLEVCLRLVTYCSGFVSLIASSWLGCN